MDTLRRLCVAVWLLALLMTTQTTAVSIAQTAPGDWPTYMGSIDRTGFNASETAITNTTASDMQLKWSVKRPSSIETQPIEANNLVYTEGMDGNEVALDTAGNQVWQSFVGTMSASCYRVLHGATSTAAVAEETVGGTPTSILYVGGFGNGQTELYALDAQTGTVLWQTALGDSVNSDNYIWSSPLVYNGSVYVGVASDGDCPLVQGTLVQMDDRRDPARLQSRTRRVCRRRHMGFTDSGRGHWYHLRRDRQSHSTRKLRNQDRLLRPVPCRPECV